MNSTSHSLSPRSFQVGKTPQQKFSLALVNSPCGAVNVRATLLATASALRNPATARGLSLRLDELADRIEAGDVPAESAHVPVALVCALLRRALLALRGGAHDDTQQLAGRLDAMAAVAAGRLL